MRTSSLVLGSLIAVLILAVGCRSRTLTRDEAGRLLTSSELFTNTVTRELVLGSDLRPGMGDSLNSYFELSDCLASSQAGYLALENGEFVLTQKGSEAEKGWAKDPERPDGRQIPVAQRELIQVTGILQEEGSGSADVQFTWRLNWTPLMAAMDFGDWAGCNPKGMFQDFGFDVGTNSFDSRNGRASIRRYDDGWRLETVNVE